ncbi:MAG: hypothetical protein KJ621_00990 [Proteobacteria bacterium]|nr:hypothetical protein [Pseudomonadota bacterium]MBU1741515.1 hypothetical protein [Pseudomonadota bacterium]
MKAVHPDPRPAVGDFLDQRTIIVGEVNSGKTAYLCAVLDEFLKAGLTDIAVIDLAPDRFQGIGGKMSGDRLAKVRHYSPRIIPPRLRGRSDEEIEALAEGNAELIEAILAQYLPEPARVLFINDVSLFLQARDPATLLGHIESTPTVILNGYFGASLGGGEFGRRERCRMKALQKWCDRVIGM